MAIHRTMAVALRKESVDRNETLIILTKQLNGSLSARRAWIEILAYPDMIICTKSLSARRAWIEIIIVTRTLTGCVVALRKESVDRNYIIKITVPPPRRRSPQGERG